MKKETSIRRIFGAALLGLLGLAFWNCEDSSTGPGDPPDETPNPYKGRWLPVKLQTISYWPGNDITPERWDTTDFTSDIKYREYRDSTWFEVLNIRESNVADTSKYYVTEDSICSSSYAGNYLDWECSAHAFKGTDTLDQSFIAFGNTNTNIWVRTK